VAFGDSPSRSNNRIHLFCYCQPPGKKKSISGREDSPVIEVLLSYRTQKKYLLHEFVVMPDHLHLIITPKGITLERSMQLIKGGFSFQFNKNLKTRRESWQPSFFDRRVRDAFEYQKFKDYIHHNPVKRGLCKNPQEFPYSSANPLFQLDEVPQWLKPLSASASPQA
jgi:putative transposase